MTRHVVVDIEATDVDPSVNAGVLSVGIVAFDRQGIIDQRLWKLDPAWTPGSRSKSTYDWWKKQEPAIIQRAFSGTELPWAFCLEFSSFVGLNGADLIWGYPARYDLTHLRSLFRHYNCPFPLNFDQERDMTTLLDIAKQKGPHIAEGVEMIRGKNLAQHDALADAVNQALQLHWLFIELGLYRG